MDFVTAVGLIGSLLTIEEAGRSMGALFCSIFKKNLPKKQLIFSEWDTGDESTQRIVDAFKCAMQSHYKEHIFSSDEIEKIADKFLAEKHYLIVDYNQKAEIRDYIRRTFANYNEYIRSQMTLGDRVIQDSIEGITQRLEGITEQAQQMLRKDEHDNYKSFLHAVHLSKTIKLENISDKINGEYSIDRTELLSRIRTEGYKFISVQGYAGYGKSALCKLLICDEEYLLIARAEELVSTFHLKNVWDCDLQPVFQSLSDKRIVIYIDALEFIADYSEDKLVVLQELYDIANDFSNVYIVTSCRTTDRNAFIKLQTKYSIETYEVGDITTAELDGICKFYSVINELRKQYSYSELLKSPFYINLVVSNGISATDIADENMFREYIWKNIICLNQKAASYGIDSSAIYTTVNAIVFERAKRFLLGVRELDIQTSLLKVLSSEGIVTISNGLVRLKYDIFEDICFEQYFDREFEECRGNLEQFYGTISSLGRCIFRRYQIWIANKLFIKENRSKFISKLIFTSGSDPKWKKQTEIGIVKSKYCSDFFREYTTELEENKLLDEFLDIINLYAFEIRLVNRENGYDLNLIPVGKARDSMIQLIYDNSFFADNRVKRDSVVKLCSDYASLPVMIDGDKSISDAVCQIMEYYIDTEIANRLHGWYYSSEDCLGPFLTIVYRLAGSSKEWLKGFFALVKERYLSENQEECRWANDIAVWTFENVYPALTMYVGEDLCELANCIFFEEGRKHISYFSNAHSENLSYGLSDNVDRLRSSRNDTFKYFLINLFKTNFVTGLDWALRFTNRAVSCFADNSPERILNIPIFFPEKNESRSYYGNSEMWLCRADEHRVPTIISDIVYHTKNGLIEYLEFYKQDQELFRKLGERIKSEIYSKSNNIAMLSIIQEIGFHFQDELPGYALELSSSYELLYFDVPRHLLYHPNPTQKLLKKQILQIAGVPELEQRYELDDLCDSSFQEYVLKIQLSTDTFCGEKAIKIIDYLYSLVDGGTYDARWKIQAQKMDLRNSSIKDLGNSCYEISVSVPENNNARVPEKQVAHKEKETLNQEIMRIIQQVNTRLECVDYNHVDVLIDKVLESINKDDLWRIQFEEPLVQLIVISLRNKSIAKDRRDYLCSIWASGIRKLLNNNSFVTNIEWIPILYKQLDQELSFETQNLIKGIMLDSLIDKSNNGQIRKISDYTYRYLLTNERLSHNMFTTIIMLAEDKMNHQRFNAEYWQKKKGDGEFQFAPNMQRRLTHIDYYMKDHGETPGYISNRKGIIQKFLFNEEAFDFSNFELDNYDVRTLCHAANCGLTLQDDRFFAVIKQIILCIIEMGHQSDHHDRASEILGIDAKLDVIELLQREIHGGLDSFAKVLQLLFENVEFDKFTRNTSEFYLQILCCLIVQYFDAYQNAGLRGNIERKIKDLEERILAIENSTVKTELLQAAALIDSRFYSDWSKCPTAYSEKDKRFLNQQYGKYGHYHFRDFILSLYQMHIRELLPEVLISVEAVFVNSKEADIQEFHRVISKQQHVVNRIILDAYVYYSDAIKRDAELSNAYIHMLEILIEMNNEKSAILLDEFLIH